MEKKKVLKFGFFQYWKSTPVFFRKIGDTCLGITTFIATLDGFQHPKKMVIVMMLGITGKVLTNLFSLEDDET